MKIDDSNKMYSIYIAGILLILIVSVFIAFILGVLDQNIFSDNTPQTNGEVAFNSESILNNVKGNDDLVSGTKRGCDIPKWETEPGSIDVYSNVVDPTYQLPLCIEDQTDVNGFDAALDLTLTVIGGYKPTCSYLDLEQFWCGTVYDGKIKVIWTKVPEDQEPAGYCCCYDFYTASFEFYEKICLVSTELPSTYPTCMTLEDVVPDPWDVPNKLVDIDLEIKFEGCHFWLFLTSDFHFPEFPTPKNF